MSTSSATRALSIKRQLERLERIASIKSEGLLYSADVMRRFGVSNPTAVADLRGAYGELPQRPRRPQKAAPKKERTPIKEIHVNFFMSAETYAILQKGVSTVGLSRSEAIRYAIIRTFAAIPETKEVQP